MKKMLFNVSVLSATISNALKTAATCGLLLVTGAAMAEDNFINLSPLIGEYVASNPGMEFAYPNTDSVDKNGDGHVEGINVSVDVYKVGTQTKLFSTPVKYFAYTSCSSQEEHAFHDVKRISNTLIFARKFNVTCSDPNVVSDTHIYAVNLSAAGKTPWVKSFNFKDDRSVVGIGIVPDKNGNGVGELSVMVGGSGLSVYLYDGETGASVATTQKYGN